MRGYGNQAPHPPAPCPQNEGRGVFPALPQHGSPSLILGEGFGAGEVATCWMPSYSAGRPRFQIWFSDDLIHCPYSLSPVDFGCASWRQSTRSLPLIRLHAPQSNCKFSRVERPPRAIGST